MARFLLLHANDAAIFSDGNERRGRHKSREKKRGDGAAGGGGQARGGSKLTQKRSDLARTKRGDTRGAAQTPLITDN